MEKTKKYPHFDPNKYGLNVKISTVKSGNHNKHNINYHLVWIPKYRKRILKGKVVDVLANILNGQCEEMALELLALEIQPDHIHLFISATPTHRPADIVQKFKGNSSIQLRRCFPELKFLGYQKRVKRFTNLWARGYYCGSAGHVSQDAVKK